LSTQKGVEVTNEKPPDRSAGDRSINRAPDPEPSLLLGLSESVISRWIGWPTVLIVGGLLIFAFLDRRYLWQDEAETALLGKNILRYGVPIGSDGTNIVSQEAGREFVDGSPWPYYLWRWSPWLQFYVAAGSIYFLGATTFAARLPFAVVGLLTLPLTFQLARRLSGSRLVAGLSGLCLALNASFLLYTRQARWCSIAFALLVALLLAVTSLVRGSRWAVVAVATSGTALFYTNYLVGIAVLSALVPAVTVLRPGVTGLRRLGYAYAAIALLACPGLFLFNIIGLTGEFSFAGFVNQLGYYSAVYFTFLLPLPVAVLVICLCVVKRTVMSDERRRSAVFLILFSAIYTLVLSLGPWPMFRYLCVLAPLATILLGLAAEWTLRWRPLLGIGLLLAAIGTDVLHQVPLGWLALGATQARDRFPSIGPVSFPLAGFVYELAVPSDLPERSLSDYLQQHARSTDVVLTTYDDLPLQFYTGLRVVGGLQGQNLPNDPDWIILRSTIVCRDPGKDGDVLRFVQTRIDGRRYQRMNFPHRDFTLGGNPDPRYHLFRASGDAPLLLLLRRTLQR
jgi:hypothetical protein